MLRRQKWILAVLVSAFLVFPAIAATADASPSIAKFTAKGFPDNADLRGRLFAYVIGASRDVALTYGEKQLQSSAGPVTVRVEKRNADFMVEFLDASAAEPGRAGSRLLLYSEGPRQGQLHIAC